MEEYIGLDVSMKETAVSIRRAGERIWRGKCASDPSIIAELIRKRAPSVKRVVFETGPLSVWFYHSLRTEGLPAICIDARHAKAALDMATNKTDANDADGLAQLAEVGFFREVRVLRSGGGHSDAQLNTQHSAHVGSAAPGEDRLQKSCRSCGAQTGGNNAYDA